MRAYLRRFRRLRSLYAFLLTGARALRTRPAGATAVLEADYASGEDPWRYATTPATRERYAVALELLDAGGLTSPATALEVGCGEGFFTELLAPRCGRLLAVDMLPVALDRAAARVSAANVTLRRWDLRSDPSPGTFDVVVCMDVLAYIGRPWATRRAIGKLVASVAPGGGLLVGEVRQAPIVEEARWSRWLLAGAAALLDRVGEALPLGASRTTDTHRVALFRVPDADAA